MVCSLELCISCSISTPEVTLVEACLLPTSAHFSRYRLSSTFPRSASVVISNLQPFKHLQPLQTFQYTDGRGTNCTNTTNSPATNFFAETYSLGSRCVEHGRQWTWRTAIQTATPTMYGAGCYQVRLSAKWKQLP